MAAPPAEEMTGAGTLVEAREEQVYFECDWIARYTAGTGIQDYRRLIFTDRAGPSESHRGEACCPGILMSDKLAPNRIRSCTPPGQSKP